MPTNRLSFLSAALLAGGLLLGAETALACDAPPAVPRDPAGRLREYDVVARGTVTSFNSAYRFVDGGWQHHLLARWLTARPRSAGRLAGDRACERSRRAPRARA